VSGPSQEVLARWPNCPTVDCSNKVCLWMGTGLCHPCSVQVIGKAEADARYARTHPEQDWGRSHE
jgi:hypothetical protein